MTISVPRGAKPLSCAPARRSEGWVDIWYAVDDGPNTCDMTITVIGTGWEIPFDAALGDFIGTCVMPSDLVWHVFARVSEHLG